MSHDEDRVTVWMSDHLRTRMDDRVDWRYGSRSEWVREAVRYRMVLEDTLDREGLELPEDQTDRERMLEDIAIQGVRAYQNETDRE